MPDYIPAALAAAEAAIAGAAGRSAHDECDRGSHRVTGNAREFARAALEAAAPLLAEAIAQKILAHMEEHGPDPASPGITLHATMSRAWRRHFGIAARVAAGAFWTREDKLRLAAGAIRRGEFIGCDIPEVPEDDPHGH